VPVIDKTGKPVASAWTVLTDDAPLPASGPMVLPLARLLAAPEQALSLPGGVGVLLAPEDRVDDLAPLLGRLALVQIAFPKFRDGRGFTQARALREHHAYGGDIRAVGHPLPDQYLALLRCGVSTVELADDQDPAIWANVLALRGGLDTRPRTEQPVPLLRRLAASFEV
jgi:uncharacterized protein (DUF934 family)